MAFRTSWALSLLFLAALCTSNSVLSGVDAVATNRGSHTNNWAVIVNTSRFWFNYRHIANTLSVYRAVKRLGIPDSQIILMLADDMACNDRNQEPGQVFNDQRSAHPIDLYGDDIEVDYRGYEVTVENFIRLLTGRHEPGTPRSKRLLTDDRSNILIYMTGHGGDEFLKFQDAEEIGSLDLADAFQQMWQKGRYHEMLFAVDTCQAATLTQQFYSPNILTIGSASKGQDSLSHIHDFHLGITVIDKWTYQLLNYMEQVTINSQATVHDLFTFFDPKKCGSDPVWRYDLFRRDPKKTLITDFFGQVSKVEVSEHNVPLIDTMDSDIVTDSVPARELGRSDYTKPNTTWRKDRLLIEAGELPGTDERIPDGAFGTSFYMAIAAFVLVATILSLR